MYGANEDDEHKRLLGHRQSESTDAASSLAAVAGCRRGIHSRVSLGGSLRGSSKRLWSRSCRSQCGAAGAHRTDRSRSGRVWRYSLSKQDRIEAKEAVVAQLTRALEVIGRYNPQRILTLGGECSVSVAPFSWLAEPYGDDLAVLWFDSHPDVSTPASKYSGFHAMAIAVLTGHGDPDVLRLLPAILDPTRVALVGLHSWAEDDFPKIARGGIRSFGPEDLHLSSQPLLDWLKASGCSRIAIHFDVVDRNEIIFGLGAEAHGLTSNEARRLVADVSAISDVVGVTIAEFIPRQVI